MAKTTVEIGPVGKCVAERLKWLRTQRNLTQQELAAKLEEIGHHLKGSAISKIEAGDRRADVDDLVALAVALNVSPLALLLPPESIDETAVDWLTERKQAMISDMWRWALNERALPAWPGDRPDQNWQEQYEQLSQWQGLRYVKRHPTGRAADVLHDEVRELVMISGVSTERIDEEFEQRLKAVRTGIDRLAAEVDHTAAEHAELSASAKQFKANEQRRRTQGGA